MHKRFLRYPITSICPISADGEHGKEANVYLSTDISAAPVTVMERPLRAVLRNCPFIPSQCLIRTGPAQKCGGCDERVPFGQDYTLALRLATVGPFLSVDCSLAYIPHDVPGRLSADKPRELRDSTAALAHFIAGHPVPRGG